MREAGVSVSALIEYIALFQQGPSTQAARKRLLEAQLAVIDAKRQAVQATYDKLAAKNAHYDDPQLNPFAHTRKEAYHV